MPPHKHRMSSACKSHINAGTLWLNFSSDWQGPIDKATTKSAKCRITNINKLNRNNNRINTERLVLTNSTSHWQGHLAMPMSFVMPDKSFPTHVALVLFLPLHCVGTRLACPSQTVTALDPTLTGQNRRYMPDQVAIVSCLQNKIPR